VSNLFTYEYFEELGNKVKDDGLVALWFQNYRITPKELKVGLNTFASVFPHVSVWFHYTDTLDLVVIGSKKPHGFDMKRLSERVEQPAVKRELSG
jgi:spermidine synthase